jgi:hypothetical protein
MRQVLGFLTRLVLVNMLVAGWAQAGIGLDQGTIVTFTDCASGGSSAQTVTGSDYLVTVTDESTWICITASASTCASGGTKLPVGAMRLTIGNPATTKSVSCRSTNGGGDVQFTKAG